MKKYSVIPVLVLAVLVSCAKWDDSVKVNTADLKYFRTTYDECRGGFLGYARAALAKHPGARLERFRVPSETDGDLTMDYLYIPARKKNERLLILTTGIHGIEGYTGSAVLEIFFREFFPSLDFENSGLIVFHALNPHGMKNYWRFSEKNIDLNRNCSHDGKIYGIKNRGYAEFRPLLEPEGKARGGFFSTFPLVLKMVWYNLTMDKKAILEAVVCGQYEHPQGLFYGGKELQPQIAEIRSVLSGIMPRYDFTSHIDIHTAYGKRGFLHLFLNPVDGKRKEIIKSLFPGRHIDWATDKDFYQPHGDFNLFVDTLAKGTPNIPITIEFGTLDSQTTSGAITSLLTLILRNQGIRHGYASGEDRKKIDEMTMKMFYPPSQAWRSEVIGQTRSLMRNYFTKWNEIKRSDF